METSLKKKIPGADKTTLVIEAKLNLASFARLTWPGSLSVCAFRNHKQNLKLFSRSDITTNQFHII